MQRFSSYYARFFQCKQYIAQSARAVESLLRSMILPARECPRYDTKQSDGEVLVKLELCVMPITPSFPSLPVPLWPREVITDRALSMAQIELNNVLMLN